MHFNCNWEEIGAGHFQSKSCRDNFSPCNQYSEILDNVASKHVFFQLPEKLRSYLKWPTSQISEIDLETQIWMLHWEMHELERMEEGPRKYANRLKPGASHNSTDPNDYRFGLTEDEIRRYLELVDLYHGLNWLRYGSLKLYPYLMKRVYVFPRMLKDLPFHSLLRGRGWGGGY